ncbi:DUF6879 family protein [Nocardiopsis dassonvillei]|uniref:DUF6879 family protein n=1 Tax=Nocardiopsis dassonvillei TaxID=2014 RepID=UPI0036263B59
MRLEGDAWREFFDSFQHEAFRLETLPSYTVPEEEEELRRFLAGETRPAEELHTDSYLLRVRDHVERGRRIRRVHTLTSPLGDHLRFQFEWGYAFSVQAGEEVNILDFATTPDPGLPRQDFWLFDDTRVVLMHYAADGTQTGRELLEGADPAPYVAYKNLALEHAVPFTEYYKAD